MGVGLLASGLNNLLSGGGAKAVSDAATPLVINAVSQAAEDKLGNLAAIGITRGENGNFIIGQKAMMDPQKTLDSLGSLGLFDDYPKAKDKLGTLLGAGDYRMSHRPLMSGVTADDLTKAGIEGMSLPKDVYDHPQYYTFMYDESPDVMNEVMSVYNRAKGNPNAMVDVFRAVPAEADGQLNVGDWITLSPTYAQKHLESQFGGIGKIIQQQVPASAVHASMDDLAESGYYPASLEIDDKEIAPALRRYVDPDPTYSNIDLSNINNKPSPVSAIPPQSTGLSPAQEAFFKESKIRDSAGNLIPVYHSSPETFTQFDDSKLGNNTGYDNTAFGHFVTSDKEYSSKFRDLDNTGSKSGNTMKLYANIKKPITHPYMAAMKYSKDKLDKLVEDYFIATEALEDLQNLKDYAAETGDSLYDTYMDLMQFGGNPFESAALDRETLQRNGYDAVEIVEGPKYGLVEGSRDETPVSSYAVFNGSNLKSVDNLNPTSSPDIYDIKSITPEQAFTMATKTQENLNKNLRAISEKLGFPEYQDVRQKSLESIKNKIERKGGDYTAMSMKDHARSKIMMNSWNDVPKTIEALQQAYPNAKMSIENVRNDWGYSGLHITFREPNGIGVEVQLTTADHWPVKLESDAIYDNWRTIASKDPSTLEPIVQKRLYAAIKKSQALWKAANVPDLSKYANV